MTVILGALVAVLVVVLPVVFYLIDDLSGRLGKIEDERCATCPSCGRPR